MYHLKPLYFHPGLTHICLILQVDRLEERFERCLKKYVDAIVEYVRDEVKRINKRFRCVYVAYLLHESLQVLRCLAHFLSTKRKKNVEDESVDVDVFW